MGSIGDVFPYAAPVIGSTDWANWILCMDELIDRVSSQVPISALASGDLDLNGQSIVDVFGIEFKNSSDAVAATPGLIRYKDNEWYFVTAAGTVQITSAGALNAAAIGGIGGDYGLGPESVQFVNANQRYDFWDDFAGGNYGYVRARGFAINNGPNGGQACTLEYGTAANINLTLFPSLPAANRSVVTLDNLGQLSHNAAGTTITNDIYLGNVEVKHTKEREVLFGFWPQQAGWTVTAGTATNAGAVNGQQQIDVQVGWRLKSAKIRVFKAGAGNLTLNLVRVVDGAPANIATQTQAGAGTFTFTATVGAPAAAVTLEHYYILVIPDAVGDIVYHTSFKYDIP